MFASRPSFSASTTTGAATVRRCFLRTMIFGGEHNLAQSRWSTYDEAEAGHKKMCELAGVTDILEAEIIV